MTSSMKDGEGDVPTGRAGLERRVPYPKGTGPILGGKPSVEIQASLVIQSAPDEANIVVDSYGIALRSASS